MPMRSAGNIFCKKVGFGSKNDDSVDSQSMYYFQDADNIPYLVHNLISKEFKIVKS